LHKATVALLAVPVRVAAPLGALLRRSILARVSIACGLAVVIAIGIGAVARPTPTAANPPTAIVPLTQGAFATSIATNRSVTEPVHITFSTPMEPGSVASAVQVEPDTAVQLTWGADGTELTVAPKDAWAAGVFHTVTVEPGALARSGQPLTKPVRAVFLTRGVTTATVAASDTVGARVGLDSGFLVSFARPVDASTAATGIRLDPPTSGTVQAAAQPGAPTDGPVRYAFVPDQPLRPDTDYRLIVSGVRDVDGLSLGTVRLDVHTVSAAGVVRFRPAAGTQRVAREAVISVRFTDRMDRRSAAQAFSATVAGKRVPGTISWAEADRVLVFTPTGLLPYGATVSMDVATSARSVAGVPIAPTAHGTFRTVAKGVAPKPSTTRYTGGAAGHAVGGGSWAAVETYYLGLMNCTRTGGWVTSTGHCSSPGGRAVAPLRLDQGISSKVSRPYAKRLAVGNDCSHFIGGNPGDRLRRAGYSSYRWAENIGCRSGNPMSAVLGSHLFFQSEKSYNGGHYVNLMNAKYDRVGIGVWKYGTRVRLVVDFYHP
jgi:uncharacterized protein YkwD